ncbi:hypothetical protein Acsp01_02400 [Actinoplanes sp. NBRC 101535]|nr:hypothetical protein Acsp01_02400 [Actinoplanes sp. NBRC 101535]
MIRAARADVLPDVKAFGPDTDGGDSDRFADQHTAGASHQNADTTARPGGHAGRATTAHHPGR